METIKMKNTPEDYEKSREFVESLLKENQISEAVTAETMLIVEALCGKIFAENRSEDFVLKISGSSRLGYISIRLGFEGEMFLYDSDEAQEISPEDRILKAYADKIDYSYHSRYNRTNISVRRSSIASMLSCSIGLLAALILYAILNVVLSADAKTALLDNIIVPMEELFVNALLMVAAPVTFMSFLKNMTDTFIVTERNSSVRKLQKDIMISSVITVVLAILFSRFIGFLAEGRTFAYGHNGTIQMEMTIPTWISSLMPSDIFTPFMTVSPFPLFIVAVLLTYALCYSGKYFDKMKIAIETGYALFSRMLSIVIYALPFFGFWAFLDILLSSGFRVVLYLVELSIVVVVSVVMLVGYYGFRLWRIKIPVRLFLKKIVPLMQENWKIGSAIDAVPYNIRYCMRNFRMKRKQLETSMPVLAQINLNGNCFLITLVSLILMYVSGTDVTPAAILAVAILVFFLSLGAPNQPGSFLLGMVIMLNYFQASDLVPLAIFCEIFFGGFINLINILGDVVTEAELEKKTA